MLLEELGLLIGNGIHIAVVIGLEKIDVGLDLDHLNGIVVDPYRNGKKHHLGSKGEEDDSPTVVAYQHPAPFHQISKRDADIVH
jgi:hypothetical protein